MKVTFATYDRDCDISGVSTWLRRLLPRLQAAGIEVDVNVLAFGGCPGSNCAWYESHGIPFQWRPWVWDTSRDVRRCLEMAAESNPDVYVPNSILPAYYAAGYARRKGIPTIGVMHSDDPFAWGIVDEFVNGGDEHRLSELVVVSNYLKNAVEDSAARNIINIRQIGYGVPLPDHIAKPPNGIFRLVYAGRLVEEQKRVSELTQALCALLGRDSEIEAWIVGDGDARSNMERIIQASGVDAQRIQLLGQVDVSSIYPVLCKCHAFVLLSDYEGLPISMLEAMAAGVVPICLDMRSGVPEVIRHGFNGLIAKDRGEDFFAAVHRLKSDPCLQAVLSINARKTIKECYSEEKCADAWVKMLCSFGKRRAAKPLRVPSFIRLPSPNPKFAKFDRRISRLEFLWNRFRVKLGACRQNIQKRFQRAG